MGVLFGLVFVLVGAGISVITVREARSALAERGWPTAPATILESSWDDRGGEEHPYRFLVRYRYTYRGRSHQSTVYRHGWAGDDDFEPVQRLLLRYPRGARVTCRVNPRRPSDAVLEPRPVAILLLAPLALLGVAVGATVAVASLRAARPVPLGERVTVGRGGRGRGLAAGIGAVFLLAGLGTGAAMWPWLTGPIRARSWVPVRATVVSSTVRRHRSTGTRGGSSVTYRVDILYRYGWRGRTYLSNRYGFIGGSSSGYYGKRDIVRRYPPGTKVIAWVDPHDPARSVLVRGYTLRHLVLLFPLAFIVLGGYLVRRALAASGAAAAVPGAGGAAAAPGLPEAPPPAPLRTLEPGRGRLGRAAGMLALALLWNGILSVFLWQVVEGFRHGHPPWFLTVFLLPFVLAGLVLLGAFVHAVLALANPRTTITLLTPTPRLGETVRIAWRTSGRVSRLRRLRIRLVGQERATYRRGTTTHTDTSAFRTLELADLRTTSRMRSGEAEVTIPEDTMHTFRGQSNQIVWRLTVSGEIPRWPDVDDSWEVDVLPLPVEGH